MCILCVGFGVYKCAHVHKEHVREVIFKATLHISVSNMNAFVLRFVSWRSAAGVGVGTVHTLCLPVSQQRKHILYSKQKLEHGTPEFIWEITELNALAFYFT